MPLSARISTSRSRTRSPRVSPIPTPAPRSALWPGCVRRNRPKSLPSKMLWSRSTALLTAQHVSLSIPIPSTSSPLKKAHRQEEGRETRAVSRPKTIAVVQSADIQLFWSVLSTSFFWVIPLRELGLYGTARFSLKLPGIPFHLEVWALKPPVKMVPEIARRPTQSLVLQFAA